MSVFLDLLLDFVYPKQCVGCGKEGVFLCKTCLAELPKAMQVCPECTKPSINGLTHIRCRKKTSMKGIKVWYSYRNLKVKATIEEIKFGFNKELIKDVFRDDLELPIRSDLIVPVPLHRLRQNYRGFNQAEEIGKKLSEVMKIPIVNGLIRKRNTKQQAKIKDKRERQINIKGAFSVETKFTMVMKGRKILLIDDVFTSGESMRECTKVLLSSGVEEVWGFAVAR